ncbi:hypothetical protein HLH26_16495 [Gluconacetobacter sp. 1b LMG 1731]|uniref:Uncharacterized protein n=1 Tax=Gluconacetobacter dulcium TaxID=2729096 RepID=A0A7W4JYA1_9PROT|nr:hypothetical protein [Gluconacetobacter dulcium]MBB2166098.1 hypothetical protein [Gluconacetobacter dulcium]MBB2195269.1 hypothetical protein [Gluconacetobacter dulcium]MBB2196971.1 hypothetical protein [Gluconacetobacter dulcium]
MTKRKPTPPAPRRGTVVEVHHHYHGTAPVPAEEKKAPVRRKPVPTRRG